jgi:hypothetical protein
MGLLALTATMTWWNRYFMSIDGFAISARLVMDVRRIAEQAILTLLSCTHSARA